MFLWAVVHFLLPQIVGIEQAWQTAMRLSWWLFALAVALQMLSYAASGSLVHSIVRVSGEEISAPLGVAITLAGGSMGLLLAGSVGTITASFGWYRARGLTPGTATLASWLPLAVDNGVIALFSLIGLVRLFFAHELPSSVAFVAAVLTGSLVVVLLTIAFGLRHRGYLVKVVTAAVRITNRILRRPFDQTRTERVVGQAVSASGHLRGGGWRRPVTAGTLAILFDMVSLYVVFRAAGYPISFGILLSGYGVSLLIGRLSPLPGGIGATEASMVGLYQLLNVPHGPLVVAVLGYRLISFWIPSLVGFALIPYLGGTRSRMRISQ